MLSLLFVSSACASSFSLVAHMRLRSADQLEALFWDVATPGSSAYLQHQSREQIAALIGATDKDIGGVAAWMVSRGGLFQCM